jgi:guanylate kinase
MPGNLFIISAPSGAGKTSLLTAARERLSTLSVAVSHTTRQARPGEVDGVHYHYVSMDTFSRMVKDKQFVEHAEVFGNYYGTSKQAINSLLESGKDVVLEIDWQGARQIRSSYPQAISIFILPPSLSALEERLTQRGQDSPEVIASRMAVAKEEIAHYEEYDHILINDHFEQALNDLLHLLQKPEKTIPPAKGAMDELLKDI